MKSHSLKRIRWLTLLWLLPLLCACDHKELDPDKPTMIASKVQVIFDWSKAPDKEAKSMTLFMYPEDREVVQHWFSNPEGGEIKAHARNHTAVCVDNDHTYDVFIRNHHTHELLEIYTNDAGVLAGQGISTRTLPRAPGTEDQPLRNTPPMCYGTHLRDIKLNATDSTQVITFYPEELICHYKVIFEDVENLNNADLRIDGTITSLAGGYFPGQMIPNEEIVTNAFTLLADPNLTSMSSEFLTFGVPSGEKGPHIVSVYIVMRNKSRGNLYTFDVSDQVDNAPDPKHVTIRLKGLKLPDIEDDPPPEGGGMDVEIDSWDEIIIDLPV